MFFMVVKVDSETSLKEMDVTIYLAGMRALHLITDMEFQTGLEIGLSILTFWLIL